MGRCGESAPLACSREPGAQGPGEHSLAEEALGHGAQLSPPVLDQAHLPAHHQVVELLALLRDHHVGIALHTQLEACAGARSVLAGAPARLSATAQAHATHSLNHLTDGKVETQ